MGSKQRAKRVNVDRLSQEIRDFVMNLPVTLREGCVLVVDGKPLMRVEANPEFFLDRKKLKAAILERRDESLELLGDWNAANAERFEKIDEAEG
jgi:hypothetical protein